MARHALFAAVLAAAGVCQGAAYWAKDYDKALEVSKKTGRPMALVFGTEWDQKIYKPRLEGDSLAPLARYFVFAYIPVEIKNNTFFHPLFYKYQPQPESRLPMVVFADANEQKLGSTSGTLDAKAIGAEMAEALKKNGPPTTAKKAQEMERALERAKALLEKKETAAAAKLLQEIVDQNLKIAATEAAKKLLAPILESTKADLAAAKTALEQKDYAEAIAKLSALEQNFPTLEAGKEAQKELAALRKNPDAKAALEASEKKAVKKHDTPPSHKTVAAKPTTDPNDVANDFFTDDELNALDRGAAAEAQPEKPEADPGVETRRMLSLAQSWIANKRPDKAKEILRKIVASQPDSRYADQANALLKELGE